MERIACQKRETTTKVWKDYNTEDAIAITVKVSKSHGAWNNKLLLVEKCSDLVHDFTEFMPEPNKEIIKDIVDMEKKVCVGLEGFQGKDLGEIRVLTDTTLEELTEDDLMEMSVLNKCQTRRKKM